MARTTNPKVSVVMACFNASRWLAEAIESVLTQTFEDFELIVVDDGSVDESAHIIQTYSKQDSRVLIISKTNTGLADSLNVGIEQARGGWIARLDADDVYEPTRLAAQLGHLRSNPSVVLIGTGCFEIDAEGTVIKKHVYPSRHAALVRHLVRVQRFFPHSSALFSRTLAHKLGGYRTRMRRAQDRDLWLRLSEKGQLGCIDGLLVRIRKHGAQISHSDSGRRQISDSRAGIVSYFLRQRGSADPIDGTEADWSAYLQWIERRLEEESHFDAQQAYAGARAALVRHHSRVIGATAFARLLISSGHGVELVRERVVGSTLPKRLAKEWISMSRADQLNTVSDSGRKR